MTTTLTSRQTGGRQLLRLFPLLTRGQLGPSRRQAACTAEALNRIVDRDLELIRAMPPDRRSRQVDRLVAIVLLSQAYRHFAAGWIGRRELRERTRFALAEATAAYAG